MSDISYALIKDQTVVNIIVIDSSVDNNFLQQIKNTEAIDLLVPADTNAAIGGTYDGQKFWLPKPYSSWIKNEEKNQWEPPTPYPQDDRSYRWVEEDLNWQLI